MGVWTQQAPIEIKIISIWKTSTVDCYTPYQLKHPSIYPQQVQLQPDIWNMQTAMRSLQKKRKQYSKSGWGVCACVIISKLLEMSITNFWIQISNKKIMLIFIINY